MPIPQRSSPNTAAAHHPMQKRLRSQVLQQEFNLAGPMLRLRLRYTQALIAKMPGVRREGVTGAAGKLQRAALIRYSRGRIDVGNRSGLEKAVCECYRVVKLEFERLLPDVPRADAFRVVRQSVV